MTVINVARNTDTLTMTIAAQFIAPVERVWQLWADPRQLERWWGPPMFPATFVEFDLTPGATASYYMTGPNGEQPHGWWRVISVDQPHTIEFEDGFSDDTGIPNPDMPTTFTQVTLRADEAGTRMEIATRFSSRAAMDQMIEMGMEEGMTLAVGQMDAIIATA